jgi:hypothetical protein
MQKRDSHQSDIIYKTYDPDKEILEIGLLNWEKYQYSGVPIEEYAEFRSATSPWDYISDYIKNSYPVTKIN